MQLKYAIRQPQSPLFKQLGAKVLSAHSDSEDYMLLNLDGDCMAGMRRALEKNVEAALLMAGDHMEYEPSIWRTRVEDFIDNIGSMVRGSARTSCGRSHLDR